jgi:long-chain fatty acid transport protein
MALGSTLSRSASLCAAAAIAAASSAARASPEDVFGYGARASALGATGAADGEGYEAVHANPALLSLARDRRLTLGMLAAIFDLQAGGLGAERGLSARSPQASTDRRLSYPPLRGGVIGATLPIPFGGVLKDRITLGLGFFTPFDVVVRGRILYPETPQFLLADRVQSVAVQAGLGADIGHGLRLGGGFSALAALTGSVLVATDTSGRVGTVVEDTLVASYAPIAGATYDLGAYRVGAALRGELKGRFNVVITVKDLGEITVPPLNISGLAQYDPLQIALEVARVRGDWRASIGVTYKHWSAYPGPAEATVRCPDTDPDTGEPFTDPCDPLVPEDPGFSDTVVPRVGVERVLPLRPSVTAKLRAGAFFEPSPAPAQTGASNLYDNHRLAFTLGYGLSAGPVNLDLFSQAHILLPRSHAKDATVPADNPGAPAVETRGFIFAGGLTAGVAF